MTQKTENLTEKEAWIALASGEYVRCLAHITHRISTGDLEVYFDGKWMASSSIGPGPYSIVPDPSKPKEEDGYIKDRMHLIDGDGYRSSIEATKAMLTFVEKHFEKRKP